MKPGEYRKRFLSAWVEQAEKQGVKVTSTTKNHHRFDFPDGTMIQAPHSPGTYRNILNARARLRRAGLNI